MKKLDKRTIEDIIPLTPIQEGMLFHYLKDPRSSLYYQHLSLGISGKIDVEVFNKAWDLVIRSNEMLRVVFRWEQETGPVQIVLKEHQLRLSYYDFSRSSAGKRRKSLEEIKDRDRRERFDLREVPFRVTWCKLEQDQYEMIISKHHILYDGWSNGVILKEFFEAYNHISTGNNTWEPPVKTKFKEFIKWNRGQDMSKQKEFWTGYLEGFDTQTQLPIKIKKRGQVEGTGDYSMILEGSIKVQLEVFIKKHRLTLASFFYSAWGILLQRYCSSRDVIFGTTVSGRSTSTKIDGIENMVGLFINTLPLRIKTWTAEKIKDLLHQVNHTLREREKYETTSLTDLKEWCQLTGSRELFDSIMVIENYPLDPRLIPKNQNNPLPLKVLSYSMKETTHYDLVIAVVTGNDIGIHFNFPAGLFTKESIRRLSLHFTNIITGILNNQETNIPALELLSAAEKKQILQDFNRTTSLYPRDKTIQQLFQDQTRETPDQIALIGPKLQNTYYRQTGHIFHLTYSKLNERSNQLAGKLRGKGVHPDTIVAIMMERSVEMIIGILGILKAGGAYLPIDTNYPQDRIDYMFNDSGAKILLTGQEIAGLYSPQVFKIRPKGAFFHLHLPPAPATSLAYIIYTSGSTGKPKGVMIRHYSVINRLNWMQAAYPIGPGDMILQKTPFVFDVSVWELFWWGFHGACLCLLNPGEEKDPVAIVEVIERFGVTTIHFVPSMLNAFLDYLETLLSKIGSGRRQSLLKSLKQVFSSGESLGVMQVDRFHVLFTGCNCPTLINLYGPTEATVDVSYFDCSGKEKLEKVPIGKSIHNIQLYVLDSELHLQPIGITGELAISGVGLARGYLNNPELTFERFKRAVISHSSLVIGSSSKTNDPSSQSPIPPFPHSPIYLTGDLARWLADGNIEFLGRMDQQVKVRGFRIELGEIENHLLVMEEIKEAVVLAREDRTGDKYLCAYIVSPGELEKSILRDHLSGRLPAYMIPSYFVQLEEIPITPNGKVDRKALPGPGISVGKDSAAPGNKIEKKLVEIWSEILLCTSLGIDDNFFELGGHSLKAMILISRLHKEFSVKVPMEELFKSPYIRGLARYILNARRSVYEDIRPVEKREYYLQSSAQKRLFFLDHFEDIGTSYNMSSVYQVKGKPDKTRYEKGFKALIRRHEALRTSFHLIDNLPVQRVHEEVEFGIEDDRSLVNGHWSLVNCQGRGEVSSPIKIGTIIKEFIRPFDLSGAPLLRLGFVTLPEEKHLLLFDMHHIISDGTSLAILVDDFTGFYEGKALPAIKIQYRDFAVWQDDMLKTGQIKVQEDYWLELYNDAPEIPRLNLPIDTNPDGQRPPVFTFAGDTYGFKLEQEEALRFKALGGGNEATVFMNVLTVLNILLYKYTGQGDIIIGCSIAGRPQAELQQVIGMFVNELPIRNNPLGEKSYREFLNEVKASALRAFENKVVPFEALVDHLSLVRDPSRNPLFGVCLSVANFEGFQKKIEHELIVPFNNENKTSKFDITLFANDAGDGIDFSIEYCTSLFKKETIRQLAVRFLNIIRQVNTNAGIRLREIDILTRQEREQLLLEFNQTDVSYLEDKAIHELFEEQVKRTPDRIAVLGHGCMDGWMHEDVHITYSELNRKANQLARYLSLERGIVPGERVGILMAPSSELIIALLGTLKTGGAYVPLEPSLPEERLKAIINDAVIGVVISQKNHIRKLNRLQWECKMFHTFLCPDSRDIYGECEEETNELMDEKLWTYVGEIGVDDITAGGWFTSYTGEPFTREEMEEYGDNILKKLTPILHRQMRVFEIGCASGISMYRVAPLVDFYLGTDLSLVIIEKNKERVKQEKHQNIALACVPAHRIDMLGEKDFDLVILNSVIQSFHGHNYLRQVIRKVVDLMADTGYLFIGDIMDQDLKKDLVLEMIRFKQEHSNNAGVFKTKTDWSSELFISRSFLVDLIIEIPEIREVTTSKKIYTIENELTKFRYDSLLEVNKMFLQGVRGGGVLEKSPPGRRRQKHKYQVDLSVIERYETERGETVVSPVGPGNSAYIIYTSGTTGRPKGVVVEHRALLNYVWWGMKCYITKGAKDYVFPLYTPLSFDLTVTSIFLPLISGHCIAVYDTGLGEDQKRFPILDIIKHDGVDVVKTTPSHLRLLQSDISPVKENSRLKKFIVGGEELDRDLAGDIYEGFSRRVEIYNEYGPTEATVGCMIHTFDHERDRGKGVPIGSPIDNMKIYVLDNDLNPVPANAAGEICIAGVGLARGYLNQPELTEMKFVRAVIRHSSFVISSSEKLSKPTNDRPSKLSSNDQCPMTNDRLYRTGDLARRLPDGNIEFLGRMDQQVKIRGFRIELSEIENQLMLIEGIKKAVVLAREDRPGDKYLCAYIISQEELESSILRDHLSENLPDYMIPSYFVQLEEIPLTPNGKTDRKGLPGPGISVGKDYAAPRDKIERKLVEIWLEILCRDALHASQLRTSLGIDANFFELGGYSLKVTLQVAKIHKEFEVKIPLAEVFKRQTIRQLAEYIKAAKKSKYGGIELVEKKEYYALSSAQKRMYFLQQIDFESTAYNMPSFLTLGKAMGKEKLESALQELISRHDSLRTSFVCVNDIPAQRIHDSVEFKIEYYDMKEVEEERSSLLEGTRGFASLFIKEFIRPFDLSQAPLLRVALIKLLHTPAALRSHPQRGTYNSQEGKERKYILIVDMHHIISDGTSTSVLVEDFLELYRGNRLPELRLQYKDFSQWQNGLLESGQIKVQEDYWLDLYSDAGRIPRLFLPADQRRPEIFTFAGDRYSFIIEKDDAVRFKALSIREGGTLYMNILAVLNTLFYRYTSQEDIIIGSGIAGRPHADLQRIMGIFVNTLAIRNFPHGEKTYRSFLKEVIAHSFTAFENQDLQFEELVDNLELERDPSRNPLFDVCMVVQNFARFEPGRVKRENFKQVQVLPEVDENLPTITYRNLTAKFDITFFVYEQGEDVYFEIEYYTAIFKPDTIKRLVSHLKNTIRAVIKEPGIKIKDIEIMTPPEKRHVLFELNDTAKPYPGNKTIHELFERQVEQNPDYLVLVGPTFSMTDTTSPAVPGNFQLTYGELNKKANQVANVLDEEKNIKPDEPLGIMLERSIEFIIALLGVLKAGGAYIPMEPGLPGERIKHIINDARVQIVLTQEKNVRQFKRLQGQCQCFSTYLCMERFNIQGEIEEKPLRKVYPGNLVYIIYTSGTMGAPRGVMIEHGSLVNLCYWHNHYYQVTESDHAALYAGFGFDASVWELYPYLLKGACLYMIDDSMRPDLERLNDYFERTLITIGFLPTQFCEQFMRLNRKNRGMRALLTGGDKLHTYVKNNYALYNNYGPTENTVVTTASKVDRQWDNIPIGSPIHNTCVYILARDSFRLQPIGVPGELCISGKGLGRGYLNNPELTNEKFRILDKPGYHRPHMSYRSYIIYKTGDLARWLEEGNLQFFGRIDQQVKIRGFRIELAEIEKRLVQHPGVKEAVVQVLGNQPGDKYLCAYFVPGDKAALDQTPQPSPAESMAVEIKEYLSQFLPDYMIPSYFVQLDRIPLTPSGKVNRKALPAPGLIPGSEYVPPGDEIEKKLAAVWAEVLARDEGHPTLGIDDNFFELGGHSLKAAVLATRIHKEMKVKVPLVKIFQFQTIRRLAGYIKNVAKTTYADIEPIEKKEYYALSSAQKRLYFLQQIDLTSTSYNIPMVLPLGKDTDKNRLELALKKLVTRHESLRTSFVRVGDEQVQKVHEPGEIEFAVEYYDISGKNYKTQITNTAAPFGQVNAGGERGGRHDLASIIQGFVRPFDLTQAPLMRSGIIEHPGGDYAWMVDMHHIISDGTSQTILYEDFITLYQGDELSSLRIQYKDFAQWQEDLFAKGTLKAQEDYWRNLFPETGEIPRLDLPGDYKRPDIFTFAGSRCDFMLEREYGEKLTALAARNNGTLYMNILAGLNTLFYKYTGQTDIIIGTGIAGRTHADLQQIMGMFVNTLAMRNHPQGDKTYETFLQEVIAHSTRAFENQDVQFEELVNQLTVTRDASRNPLFDIFMIAQNFRKPGEVDPQKQNPGQIQGEILPMPEENFSAVEYENLNSKFDMTFFVIEDQGRIHMPIEYYTGIFKQETVKRMTTHFKNIVKTIIKTPGIKLKDIEITTLEERKQVLYEFNAFAREIPREKTLDELFAQQVERTPDHTALKGPKLQITNYQPSRALQADLDAGSEDVSITYKELDCQATELGTVLKEKGVVRDTIVGIMMERSIEMIMSILGIFKAGGAYLPIDPDYPQERQQYMSADSGAKILLKDNNFAPQAFNNRPKGASTHLHLSPWVNAPVTSLAYVIYTSGSTGQPKGVLLEHQNLVNLLIWGIQYTNLDFGTVLQYASISFDASFHEIFSTLLSGGRLCLIHKDVRTHIPRLLEVIRQNDIKTVFLPISLLKVIFSEKDYIKCFPSCVTHIQTAGEQVIVSDSFRDYLKENKVYLHNHYGPTEAHVVTALTLDPAGEIPTLPSIGKPVTNTCIYILDPHGKVQPIGIPGELCIGGIQVGRGYLNNPALTAEKFDHDLWDYRDYHDKKNRSFLGGPGGRFFKKAPLAAGGKLYKTGDLARWLFDGNIEFLGRRDFQVKIRGYRIELEEIQNQLLKHPGIKETAVTVREKEPGDKYICAYFVRASNDEPPSAEGLKEYLSQTLPEYIIPTYFVQLDTLPLTLSGKVNSKALPAPGIIPGEEYAAPRDEIEKKLAVIWTEVLGGDGLSLQGRPSLGIDDNFFQLGGHSLKATILTAKIHKEFKVNVYLAEIFQRQTIRRLSEYIRNRPKEAYIGIKPVEKKEYYALSSAQKRLYFIQQMDLTSTSYNIPLVLSLGKDTDINKLEVVLKKLAARHESLRTSFIILADKPVQKVHDFDDVEFEIEYNEASQVEVKAEVEGVIKKFIRPFDLSQAPLIRSGLIKHPGDYHTWVVDIHHIISDGTSQTILTEDFITLYKGNPLPPLRIQYKDFAPWQNDLLASGAVKAQENYWMSLFRDSGEIPRLQLPVDHKRPEVFTFAGDRYRFTLEQEDTVKFRDLGLQSDGTLYMNILTALNTLFYKYTSQEDIIIGSGIAGRPHAELQKIVGMFVNTLAMRNYPQGDRTYEDFLKEVICNSINAYENQDVQFESLVDKLGVKRDTSRNPLFDVFMILQNFRKPNETGSRGENPGQNQAEILPRTDKDLSPITYENVTSKFDMTFNIQEMQDNVYIIIEYYKAIFKKETIQRLVSHFKNVIKAVVKEPSIKLKDINIIPQQDQEQLLYEFNATSRDYHRDKTVHQMFQEQVERNPDRTVLVGNGQWVVGKIENMQLTYRELNEKSNRLAHLLIDKGVQPGTIVALMQERSIEMIRGILAILKAGGAYLPIDVQYPRARKIFMLKDSRVKLLLTNYDIKHRDQFVLIFKENEIEIPGDRDEALYPGNTDNPEHTGSAANLIYLMYTSGSTGLPKGVMLEHRNLVNLLIWGFRYTGLDFSSVLQYAAISFDASFHEIFSTLLSGGKLCLINEEMRTNIPSLFNLIAKNQVKTLFLPISLLKIIFSQEDYPGMFPSCVDHIQTAGEQVVVSDRFREYLRKNKIYLHNHYGPTEAQVVTALTLDPGGEIPMLPTIGKPVSNTCIYILDSHGKMQPVRIPGELCIGGIQVGRGYLNRPGLTAEKFKRAVISHSSLVISSSLKTNDKFSKVPNDQCPMTNDRLYKTGDLARWLSDGNIEFLGRMDYQVKIRGFRIELGEIEAQLIKHDLIKEVAVTARKNTNEETYLCAYIVGTIGEADPAAGKGELKHTKLRDYLSQKLPDYMIPAYFIRLGKIPLTINGKVNHNALPTPSAPGIINRENYIAPRDEIEKKLLGIWHKVLDDSPGDTARSGPPPIGIDNNFFEIGGHSLKATLLAAKIHQEFKVHIPLVKMFKYQTIRGMSGYIKKVAKTSYVDIVPGEKKEYYALSSAQKRLYILQQMDKENIGFNMTQVVSLKGDPDRERLRQSLCRMIQRHESLRTSIVSLAEEPVQRTQEKVEFEIEYDDLQETGDHHSSFIIHHSFVRPFDPGQAPFLRVILLKIKAQQYILGIDMHHLVSDGISLGIFVKELMALYQGEELPGQRIQYRDYAAWQNSKQQRSTLTKQEKYWLHRFPIGQEIPRLNLPTDYPRPPVLSFAGNLMTFQIDKEKTTAIKTLVLEENVTLYIMLLTIYYIWLYKITGQEDIIIGTPTAGRRHADLQHIIGIFINTLTLRDYPNSEKTFSSFLQEVKKHTLEAFENQDYQFQDLVEKISAKRDSSRNPLFDVMFALENFGFPNVEVPGLKLEPYHYKRNTSPMNLSLITAEIQGKLQFTFEYCTRLFKEETIKKFSQRFEEIVTQVLENHNIRLQDITISHHYQPAAPGIAREDNFNFQFT